MNILVINCGSSSLKYQLIDSSTENVLAKGLCERIGLEGSSITHKSAGKDKAEQAARMAINSPLIETSMENARGVIISITGSDDIGLEEVELASSIISDMAHPDATIIWGAQLDDTLEDTIRVTVVATGLGEDTKEENNDFASFLNNTGDDEDAYGDVMSFFKKD